MIGHTLQTSNNFSYAGAIDESVTIKISSLASVDWQSNNKVVLDDCTAAGFWDVQSPQGNNGGQITYAVCLTAAIPLTANFTAISTPSRTCSASTSAVSTTKS